MLDVDLVYVVATIAFFGLMLAFVRGLEVLGRERDGTERSSGGKRP